MCHSFFVLHLYCKSITEKRRCLNNLNYMAHLDLLKKLQKNATHWAANNQNKSN